jgi:hypothetical protein
MITSGIDWLVENGAISEEEKESLLEFHLRSRSRRLPNVAAARQRNIAAVIDDYYAKANGNLAQGYFRALMNMDGQWGRISRLQAEERNVKWVRERFDPDFTPLRR